MVDGGRENPLNKNLPNRSFDRSEFLIPHSAFICAFGASPLTFPPFRAIMYVLHNFTKGHHHEFNHMYQLRCRM